MGKTCHDLTFFMCSFRLRSSLRSRPFASRTSWLLVVHVHVIGRAIRACLHVAPYLERRAACQPERRLEQAHVPNVARAVALKREAR